MIGPRSTVNAHRQDRCPSASRTTIVCSAGALETRRQALLLATGAALFAASPAALARTVETVCSDKDTGEEAAECRMARLAEDKDSTMSYKQAQEKQGTGKGAYGVPVSKLDDVYGKATVELAQRLDEYFTMDVYDKKRAPLIKELKAESNAWVSKYARGGSVRKMSARKMYIAVDSVQGHLASAGLAPFPATKQKVVDGTIMEALAFLEQGK